MSAEASRFLDFWRAADDRARLWFWCFVASMGLTALSLAGTLSLLGRPREVVRIGCDGIPQVVALNESAYGEPNELEIRAFATLFATALARQDSFSLVHDWSFASGLMAPDLRKRFAEEATPADGQPGTFAAIEGLHRRTQIDAESLEMEISKRDYPWRVRTKGVRQVVGTGKEPAKEPFEMEMKIVRSERTRKNPFGQLVWEYTSPGGPLGVPIGLRPSEVRHRR